MQRICYVHCLKLRSTTCCYLENNDEKQKKKKRTNDSFVCWMKILISVNFLDIHK